MYTFLDFIQERKEMQVYEAFNTKNIDFVTEKINSILLKHIDGLVPLVGYQKTTIEKQNFLSSQYIIVDSKSPSKSSMFQINWLESKNDVYAYSIDFFKNVNYLFTGEGKSDLSIYTLGSSIIYFLPIIWTIVTSQNYNLSEKKAIEIGRSYFKNAEIKESLYYIGALPYHVFESLNNKTVFDIFKKTINEAIDPKLNEYADKKRRDALQAYADKDEKKANKLADEFSEINSAIKGGASDLKELKLAIKRNVNLIAEISEEMKSFESQLKGQSEDPEQTFKKMQGYVKMVITGINPSVILCGAPGVGKTYRIKQQLKANNYKEGENLFTIKGKCTPRRLYLALYEYQNKGQILLIDDADGLVGPGAPEECINILKAALDSTSDDEGRLISYGISGKLLDDDGNEVPKRFYYNGGVLVITNWNAGKLDTALRGRSYIQDINFTTEQVLQIIKNLMPKIEPETLSQESKTKAYNYLVELSEEGAEMEISIRTFGICAKIFEACSGDINFSDDDAKSMIKEQMKLQASRISGKGNKGKY